ncbi:MAG: ABC transporter substrate-binding protein, partial [Gammaproteobacteria bacterium]|nr:ABC transporter substrate-binding protein [Gammaproteobacteria bacterium]
MAARASMSAVARFAHAACLLALLWFAGAAQAATVVDDRGVEQTFSRAPARIVSMLPSLTETVCALQACEHLVGVDDYSNWPERLRSVPRVGGLDDANVERIVSLRPDVVLLARSARVIERLESLGIRVVVLEPRSIDDMRRVIATVGQLLDRSAQAEALWRDIDAAIRRAADALPAAARGTRVYFEVSSA